MIKRMKRPVEFAPKKKKSKKSISKILKIMMMGIWNYGLNLTATLFIEPLTCIGRIMLAAFGIKREEMIETEKEMRLSEFPR